MARAPDERITEAKAMYLQGLKLIEIAGKLSLPEGTVRSWKNRYNWDCNVAKDKRNVAKARGAPLGNRNAVDHGAPEQNKNAEKHGLFSKYLPKETFSIIQNMPTAPLDILWDQIQIAYAAIMRAQQIMYVRDRDDMTTTKIAESCGDTSSSEKWEVQQAWDKQGSFMQAQARAQSELRSLIKQYDELLHKNWELATEEQRARIDALRAKVEKDEDKPVQVGFEKAGENNG